MALHADGRGFNSLRAYHSHVAHLAERLGHIQEVEGSTPSVATKILGCAARLVERRLHTLKVEGSTPSAPTPTLLARPHEIRSRAGG